MASDILLALRLHQHHQLLYLSTLRADVESVTLQVRTRHVSFIHWNPASSKSYRAGLSCICVTSCVLPRETGEAANNGNLRKR